MTKFLVKHSGKDYDVIRFLHFHPGGSNTLEMFQGSDITDQLEKTNHSQAAYALLKDYRVRNENDGNQESDLENLVNWDKAMFWQVGALGPKYFQWVLSPVDRKLRLFHYDFMERLTITPWYLVPAIWVPVTMYLIYLGYKNLILTSPFDNCSQFYLCGVIFFIVLLGYFIWPILEYSIHRWLFHMEPPENSWLLITLHFTIHGLHHKVPFDSQRLLFPPAATALVVAFMYYVLGLFLPVSITLLLVAGGILGYVSYDLIHFYLHYGSPSEGTYFYHMKRYHNHHHFTQHESGFGISSPIWDYAFNTTIKLRKLKYRLKW